MLASFHRVLHDEQWPATARSIQEGLAGANAPTVPTLYSCRDGFAFVTVALVPAFADMVARIAGWLIDEGALAPEFSDEPWVESARQIGPNQPLSGSIEALINALKRVCAQKTKMEVLELAREHRFMVAPVMTMADIAAFEQFHERDLFLETEVDGKPVPLPARFAQFENFRIELDRSAPTISQHTSEILCDELAYTPAEVQALFEHRVV